MSAKSDLAEEIQSLGNRLAFARTSLDRGKVVELASLEPRVTRLCDELRALPEQDARGLEGGLVSVLEDPGRVGSLGEAARRRVLAHFGWESCVGAYEQLYAQLSDGRGHVGS